jgi:uncharacterized membrane protein
VHAAGQEFDLCVRQTDKMKITTAVVVSIISSFSLETRPIVIAIHKAIFLQVKTEIKEIYVNDNKHVTFLVISNLLIL